MFYFFKWSPDFSCTKERKRKSEGTKTILKERKPERKKERKKEKRKKERKRRKTFVKKQYYFVVA